jgi:hypothetical protein
VNSPPHGIPWKDPEWLDYIRTLRCTLTGTSQDIVPHHVRMAGWCGTSLKPPDYFAVPMNWEIHQKRHAKSWTVEERFLIAERLVYLQNEYFAQKLSLEPRF